MRTWQIVWIACLAGCGAKTGLDLSLPVCPDARLVPSACTRVEVAASFVLGPPPPLARTAVTAVGDGVLVYSVDDASVILRTLDPNGAPRSTVTLPRPVPVGRLLTSGVSASCFTVFSLHSATLEDEAGRTGPGPCAFWLEGTPAFRYLPGSYDRCYSAGIEPEGLRFIVESGGAREELYVGVDGALGRRTPVREGLGRLFAIELGDGRATEVRATPALDAFLIVSPDGVTTRIERAALLGHVGRSLVWRGETGVLASSMLDAAGVPMLPPLLHPELGTGLSGVAFRETAFGAWLVLQRTAAATLLPVAEGLVALSEPLVLELEVSHRIVAVEDGLLVVGERADEALVATHLRCAP